MTKRELETCPVQCPYCWESFAVVVDCSVPSQRYIEDCEVCCRPLVISLCLSGTDITDFEAAPE